MKDMNLSVYREVEPTVKQPRIMSTREVAALIVDIGGIKAEDDYLAWLRGVYGQAIGRHPTNRSELYQKNSQNRDRGPINSWGLCVDDEFIRIATNRAKLLISESWRYSASMVFEGLKT